MLHSKFRRNRAAISGEDFCPVFAIYGNGGHLGHVTSIMSSDFHFLVAESFHTEQNRTEHNFINIKLRPYADGVRAKSTNIQTNIHSI